MNTGIYWNDRKIKNEAMDTVGWEIKRQHIKPIDGKAVVKIVCYEPNKRRDPSNVRAGAEKVILDSLQKCGIIKNDNWKYLEDIPARVEYDKGMPRIEVEIGEVEK